MTMLTRLYDESDKMKSKEEEQPNKKVLFEVIDLIEKIARFQNNDIAKNCESILHNSASCLCRHYFLLRPV